VGLWSVTRLENGQQTSLYLDDIEYGLTEGGSAPWEGSFCVSMTAGLAPRVAPDVSAVPLYRDAPVAQALPTGAYAGVPLLEPDGELFGTLCGISATARGEEFRDQQRLFEVPASLLGIVLAADRGRDAALLAASVASELADTDPMTGLLNRRGWGRRIAQEQERVARYADRRSSSPWTSTGSSRSTTSGVTPRGTRTSRPPDARCARPSAPTTRSRGSAATSSPSCSPAAPRPPPRPAWPGSVVR
jgi:hypothetical protein